MLRYTLKRILTGVLSLFVLATVTFFLVRLIPGSPFQRGGVSTQVVEAVEEEYGLNEPLFEQYVTYMGSLLRGDLGISYQDPGTEVAEIIGRAWPITASLGITALAAAMILGTALGVIRAVAENRALREELTRLRAQQDQISQAILDARASAETLKAESRAQEEKARETVRQALEQDLAVLEGYRQQVADLHRAIQTAMKGLEQQAEEMEQQADDLLESAPTGNLTLFQ